MEAIKTSFISILPMLAALALGIGFLVLLNWLLLTRRPQLGNEARLPRQFLLLIATVAVMVIVILTAPVGESTRNQLLALLGLLLTGAIAFSSTTFVANIMASLMLRSVGSFRPGDFIGVEGHFGRVSDRGLFHTEIQTEDSDLTTLPNLYLVSHPIRVVRSSGTIVSATVSLGYDIERSHVEGLLLKAASAADLKDAFVQVMELGNFSVTYRIAGFLPEVKHLLSARSSLRKMVLDSLHGAGVEIVSPTFMNQRQFEAGVRFIPDGDISTRAHSQTKSPAPEKVIFDKAEEAEKLEQLRAERIRMLEQIKEMEIRLKESVNSEKAVLERKIGLMRLQLESINSSLEIQP